MRSRHAFLIAIQVRLLPKFSTTKQVCSKSTSKVFLRISYLVPAQVLSFFFAPCGHLVTGDLNIVRNDKLRDLLHKGPKHREHVSFSWHQNLDIIMDACEAYARRWEKKEDVELDTLSEWIKSIGDVLKRKIRRLKHSVNTRHESIFSDPDVVTELSRLHENFVIVPADKASKNYTFVCKRYYVDILTSFTSWKPYI